MDKAYLVREVKSFLMDEDGVGVIELKTTFLFPKQKIIANPLSMRICRYFVHFLNFFQNPKQAVKSYLKFSPIFQNEFFQYRPILAVKFLTASRVCAAKVGAGIKKEPPLREALGEISFAVMFLHKESFGSSTSLMPYKQHQRCNPDQSSGLHP